MFMDFDPRSIVPVLAILLAGCASGDESDLVATEDIPPLSPYLYLWAGDLDQVAGEPDFLAVMDVDPASTAYGQILSSTPIGIGGTRPHHAEPVAPGQGFLFANGFNSGRTFLFDLSQPDEPRLAGELDSVPGFRAPHSFLRLDDGDVIVTLQQGDGSVAGDPGALARFGPTGELLAVRSASDDAYPGEIIRPYGVEVVPDFDRVVTTGRTMAFRDEQAADLVQVWRLSDLELLSTLRVPRVAPRSEPECFLGVGDACSADHYAAEHQPFELRAMSDGSVLMNSFACGFYRIDGLDGESPSIELVHNWPVAWGCSVPAMVGRYYVMPVLFSEAVVVLDVSDPTAPVEVSSFATPGYSPHWAAADPRGSRVVVTSDGPTPSLEVLMFDVDPETGALSLDSSFGSPSFPNAGVSFDRLEWPHGDFGAALPHAALFGN